MDQQNVQVGKAIKVLSGLGVKDLEFINRSIIISKSRRLPVEKASEILSMHMGNKKVAFKDNKGNPHIGVIKKIAQRYVRILDESENRIFAVIPGQIRAATEDEIKMGKAGVRTKRKYTRRSKQSEPEVKKEDETQAKGKPDQTPVVMYGRRSTDIVPQK
jgi:hypothetical protein